MNAIEKSLVVAMRNGKMFRGGNTAFNPETGLVHFYSTAIAEYKNDRLRKVTLGGYLTKTTQSRVNALLQAFRNNHINVKKGAVFYNSEKYSAMDWIATE